MKPTSLGLCVLGVMGFRFIPVANLDINKRYEIVGIPKCGTPSLAKYMREKGFDVIESEFSFLDYEKAINHNYRWRTPIIITRNRIERTWSDYNFFKRDSLFEASRFSYYKAGLQMWDALIYSLEYLKTIEDFPKINDNDKKPIMTDEIKKQVLLELGHK